MIPGGNILNLALSVIAPQTLQYYEFISRVGNEIGVINNNYKPPVNISGSFQPVPNSVYSYMGLDFKKEYWMFYASSNMLNLTRGRAGDRLVFQNKTYEIMDADEWFAIDGWNGVLCVLIDNEYIQPPSVWNDAAVWNDAGFWRD